MGSFASSSAHAASRRAWAASRSASKRRRVAAISCSAGALARALAEARRSRSVRGMPARAALRCLAQMPRSFTTPATAVGATAEATSARWRLRIRVKASSSRRASAARAASARRFSRASAAWAFLDRLDRTSARLRLSVVTVASPPLPDPPGPSLPGRRCCRRAVIPVARGESAVRSCCGTARWEVSRHSLRSERRIRTGQRTAGTLPSSIRV